MADIAPQILELQQQLRSFTRRFTSDPEESRDLVQDTILRALQYRDKFREDTNLKGWLFTIMRNTFINNYRRAKRFPVRRDGSTELRALNVADTHTFSGADTRCEYKNLWSKIQSMRAELEVPFTMHTSGYKYHEIAAHLNVPVGTVKNRIFNARKEIQKLITGYR